jgi:hypothetical protein
MKHKCLLEKLLVTAYQKWGKMQSSLLWTLKIVNGTAVRMTLSGLLRCFRLITWAVVSTFHTKTAVAQHEDSTSPIQKPVTGRNPESVLFHFQPHIYPIFFLVVSFLSILGLPIQYFTTQHP